VFGPSWFDLAITVPVHATAAEDGDPALSTGADCALRIPIGGLISIGGHGSYLLDIDSSDEADKTRSTVVVGPFASVAIPVGDSIMVSAGCMYEITQFENADDSIRQIVPAVNLGVRLTDNLAVNLYGIHFMNMDDELSDFDYTDVGGEVAVAMGIWKLSLGGKTSMGIEALDSIEAYFGSSWLF